MCALLLGRTTVFLEIKFFQTQFSSFSFNSRGVPKFYIVHRIILNLLISNTFDQIPRMLRSRLLIFKAFLEGVPSVFDVLVFVCCVEFVSFVCFLDVGDGMFVC